MVEGKEAAERLAADREAWETFERFQEHLWYNDVTLKDAWSVRFGKKLTINPEERGIRRKRIVGRECDADAGLSQTVRRSFPERIGVKRQLIARTYSTAARFRVG